MQFDRNKLRSVVAYSIASCRPEDLGSVKLHRVLYFSDMLRYAEVGNSITGSTYKKRPFGPTCEQLRSTLAQMISEGLVEQTSVDYFGYRKSQFRLTREIEFQELAGDEKLLLDEVIEFVCEKHSARTVSELSHGRPWETVEFGDEIRYNSVYHIFPTEVSDEAFDWASNQVQEIAGTRSLSETVDFADFASFRSKVFEARGSK